MHFYKWLAWMTNTLQAALIIYFYPGRWVNEGNAQGAASGGRRAACRTSGPIWIGCWLAPRYNG